MTEEVLDYRRGLCRGRERRTKAEEAEEGAVLMAAWTLSCRV